MIDKVKNPDKIISYFKLQWLNLLIVSGTGLIYNIGLAAGPFFEGQLVQRLYDVLNHEKTLNDMLVLALIYLLVILVVQSARCLKRYYVRKFANETSRNMRHMLYNTLVNQSRRELEDEKAGSLMTKAVSDVDACVEGMRKFTTEIFDTGVVLITYLIILFYYDWKLTLISCSFVPVAYLIANQLKKTITQNNLAYKKSAGRLNEAVLDRVENALTYRVYGRENDRNEAFEKCLSDYEAKSIKANIYETGMKPIYHVIAMIGIIPLLYFSVKNVSGTGWESWNLAVFTTYLACFNKLAAKASTSAKLFNAVAKAKVSWQRVKGLMHEYIEPSKDSMMDFTKSYDLEINQLEFAYPAKEALFKNLSLYAKPGEIIGVTGIIASGKSSFGKVFLMEYPYLGSVKIGEYELNKLSKYELSQLISYMGHQSELMSDSIEENIQLGDKKAVEPYLKMVQFDEEVKNMTLGSKTYVGSGGIQLSGGQQARIALARTLYHGKKILILDDPFAAVDKKTEELIYESLRLYAKDKIVILISHRLNLFPKLDQVVFIDGENTRVSTHNHLINEHVKYAHLYETQQAGGENHA